MPRLDLSPIARPVRQARSIPADAGALEGRGISRLGQTVDRTAQILNAAMDQRARLGVSQYQSALQADANAILSDPTNLESRRELFDKAKQARAEEFRTGSHSTFDREASIVGDRIRVGFSHTSNMEGIRQGQESLEMNVSALADDWAQAAESPEDQQLIDQRARNALESGVASGLIDENAMGKALDSYKRQRQRGVYFRALREDPEAAVLMMAEPNPAVGEVERQELLTRALRAQESVLRERRLVIQEAEKAEEEAEEARAEEIEQQLLKKDANGSLTVGDVTAVTPFIGSERGRIWTDRARKGKGASSSRDRETYVQLDNRVLSGDPNVGAAITQAYLDNKITHQDKKDLTEGDLHARFGVAKRFLSDSLDTGMSILPPTAAAALSARTALAEQEFDVWRAANEDATAQESMARAAHLSKTAQMIDMEGIGAFNLQPSIRVRGADGSLDFEATNDAIVSANTAGTMTTEEAEFDLMLLERLEAIRNQTTAASEAP